MPKDHPATEADRAAIIDVIRAETEAFLALDFEAWAACWLHEDRALSVSTSPATGLCKVAGWDHIAQEIRQVFDRGYGCDMAAFRQENHEITLSGDLAWVVFDEWVQDSSGAEVTTFGSRVLERVEGAWKIAYLSFMLERDPGVQRLDVAVDAQGQVLHATPESLACLKTHPTLTLSAGRIRAHRRDWDKVLQSEILRAGQYHGYFELSRFASETGGPFQFPVVLGETDDGGRALTFLTVRNRMTYIRLDADAQLDRRLATARAVFGLSEAQTRLAGLIAHGDGVQQAADKLGISVNTARTHLTRLYEKTGVHAQTALVRLLLSVG